MDVCMCMYVCMYVAMYVCVCVYIHTHGTLYLFIIQCLINIVTNFFTADKIFFSTK